MVEYKRTKKRKLVITPTRRRLMDFLLSYRHEHGFGPTMDEMAAELDVHVNAITYQLQKLSAMGKAECDRAPHGRVIQRSWRVRQ